MTDFLIIMIGINLCQIISIMMAVYLKRRRSIEYMGPSVDAVLDDSFKEKLQIPQLDDTVVVFFDFNCETCKQLLSEVVTKKLSDDRVFYVAAGTQQEMNAYKEQLHFVADINLASDKYLSNGLRIQTFPFMIKIVDGTVVKKGLASYDLLCSYLGREK